MAGVIKAVFDKLPKGRIAGSQCLVCNHILCSEIEQDIMNGASHTVLAMQYGLSIDSLSRHWRNHVLDQSKGAGGVVLSLRDVLSIPLQMKERAQLTRALLNIALLPLMGDGGGLPAAQRGLNNVQTQFVIALMRIQQKDEETILKVTGMLHESGDARADLVVTEGYRNIQAMLQQKLLAASKGDGDAAAEARLMLAEMLMPMEEMLGEPDPYQGDWRVPQ